MESDSKYTSQGFEKTKKLGDDLNRRCLLAKKITDLMPDYYQHYDALNSQLAKITYGKYSYFLHLCYAKKLEELKQETDKVLAYV